MTFTTGKNAVITISGYANVNGNAQEIILRDSGRFVVRYPNEFVALSNKKQRSITISGSIPASWTADYFSNHEQPAVVSEFGSAEIFPQDLIDEYKPEELELYGVVSLVDLAIATKPADAASARLLGANCQYWIARQALSSWAPEDSIIFNALAYNHIPKVDETEGVTTTTTKKKLIPIFTPIKTHLKVRKLVDLVHLYSDVTIWGHCAASTNGGSIAGTATLDQRLVIGQGFLPEEVEELLSPSQ